MKGLMTRSSTRSSYASSHFRNYTPIQHTREAEHLKLTSNNKLYDMSAAGHVGMPLSSAVVVWYGIQSKAPLSAALPKTTPVIPTQHVFVERPLHSLLGQHSIYLGLAVAKEEIGRSS